MYIIPLIVILVIALAIFISPIFAVVLAILFLIGLGVFKFLGRGIEPEHATPPNQAAAPSEARTTATGDPGEGEKAGPWGETWPEKS